MNIERNMKYRRREFAPLDIYSYLNSPDVAKYCREIGKIWTPFEMAALISRSERHSISEKHSAWCELMNEYPDMPTKENHNFKSYESFHAKLVELIDYEEQTLALFKKLEAGAIYAYKGWRHGEYHRPHSEAVYTTYDKVWAAIREDWERDEVSEIVISKIFPDDMGRIVAHADYDGNLYSIDTFCDEQTHLQWYPYLKMVDWEKFIDSIRLLNSQYIDIPVPFKRGDILTEVQNRRCADNPIIFVLDSLDRDDPVMFARHLENGDETDMTAWGFAVDEDGMLHNDHMVYYDQLVYFDGKLEGKKALLHYVCLFIHDKIYLPELLTMQCRILLQHQIDSNLRCYIPENLLAENR